MQLDIRDLAIFEKLTTVSRENSVFELVCHLDIEISNSKTVVNVLFRNVVTGEFITDEIAPEFLGYCSVGSFFKGGKKLEEHPPTGIIRDITIDVPESGKFHSFSSAINDNEYNLNFIQKTKDGRTTSFFASLSKKQVCMVFKNDADKIIIPCSVIAAKYYLTSPSMRVQLIAQNLQGLYEAIYFDEKTETVLIILNTNARTDDAKRIARFAILHHAEQCWDNVMHSIRSSSYVGKNGREFSKLIAKIPVVQQDLLMKVRCHEAPNPDGGTTILVHEILEEWSGLPFKYLYLGRRANAPSGTDTVAISEFETESNNKLTNRPPSKAYKNHWVKQFNVPHHPIWDQVEFEQIQLPSRGDAQSRQVTEHVDGTVTLSTQRAKGNNPDNRVAEATFDSSPPKQDTNQRMALTEFRNMVSGFAKTSGVTGLFISPNLEVPLKGSQNRQKLTSRESYDNSLLNRRHYMYVVFQYEFKSICLVEFDQTDLTTRVGTYVLIASHGLDESDARKAAKDFVSASKINKMENYWIQQFVIFRTRPHPPNLAQSQWGRWREMVLELIM